MNSVDYKNGLVVDTARGPSKVIWADCPVLDFIEDPSKGMYIFDDFGITGGWLTTATAGGTTGQWAAYGSTGAVQGDAEKEGSVITIGSDGANESATIASLAGSFRITTTSTLALNRKLWFEARVARSSITTVTGDVFVGLADKLTTSGLMVNTIPISTTDDTLSTQPNLIGFMSNQTTAVRGGPTEWSFVYQLAAGTAVFPTNLTTLMNTVLGAVATAGQYVKLGFLFDPNALPQQIVTASTGQTAGQVVKPLIKIFVNGLVCAVFLTSVNVQGTSFPTGFMGPVMSIMNGSGTPGTLNIDWIRAAQVGNT